MQLVNTWKPCPKLEFWTQNFWIPNFKKAKLKLFNLHLMISSSYCHQSLVLGKVFRVAFHNWTTMIKTLVILAVDSTEYSRFHLFWLGLFDEYHSVESISKNTIVLINVLQLWDPTLKTLPKTELWWRLTLNNLSFCCPCLCNCLSLSNQCNIIILRIKKLDH